MELHFKKKPNTFRKRIFMQDNAQSYLVGKKLRSANKIGFSDTHLMKWSDLSLNHNHIKNL